MSEPKLWDLGFIMMIVLFGLIFLIYSISRILDRRSKLLPKQKGGGCENTNTNTNIVLAFISVFIIYKIFTSY